MSHAHPRRLSVWLSPRDQWLVHHLVSKGQRSDVSQPPNSPASSEAAQHVIARIEAGDHTFTAEELQYIRAELERILSDDLSPHNRATVERLLARISEALARG